MVEDEESVIAELARRVPASGPAAARMRVSLAYRFLQRGEPTRALEVLGDAPPEGSGDEAGRWLETLGWPSQLGDLRGIRRPSACRKRRRPAGLARPR
jgi:hypothetical protein